MSLHSTAQVRNCHQESSWFSQQALRTKFTWEILLRKPVTWGKRFSFKILDTFMRPKQVWDTNSVWIHVFSSHSSAATAYTDTTTICLDSELTIISSGKNNSSSLVSKLLRHSIFLLFFTLRISEVFHVCWLLDDSKDWTKKKKKKNSFQRFFSWMKRTFSCSVDTIEDWISLRRFVWVFPGELRFYPKIWGQRHVLHALSNLMNK